MQREVEPGLNFRRHCFYHTGKQKSSCIILKMGGNFEQDSKDSLKGGISGFESLEIIKSE